eukprot:scaffold92565_cov86-Phaeocystis_antarctica.AAC.2
MLPCVPLCAAQQRARGRSHATACRALSSPARLDVGCLIREGGDRGSMLRGGGNGGGDGGGRDSRGREVVNTGVGSVVHTT